MPVTKIEIESVGFQYADIDEVTEKYDPLKLDNGYNKLPDGEELYYSSNSVLGLWAFKDRFNDWSVTK
jgi:hypothetical protein